MMKINYKYFSLLAFASLLISSCDEGDAVVDDVTANTTRGAILRTVSVTSNELPIGVAEGFFGVDLEVQDVSNGNLVDAIDVYANFKDNTPNNGKGATSAEVLVESVSNSVFTVGVNGYPRLSYQITLPELLSGTGVSESDIDGGDEFRVRFELVLNDGRRFSFAQNSGTLTGANGSLVDNIEVYLGFRDNTVATGGTDLDKAEVLVATLPSSGFNQGPNGFPRLSYAITLSEMLTTLGVDEGDLQGSDQFTVRFELVLNDGRRFSFAQNSVP